MVWAREEVEDCIDNGLLVLEPADVRSGHVTMESLVEQCNDRMVPVGVLGLSRREKIIRPGSKMGEGASAEKEMHELVRSRIKMINDQMKTRYSSQRNKGLSSKLRNHCKGPHRVVKKLDDMVYRIRKCGRLISGIKVVHLERLAAYGRSESMPIRDEQA